MTAYELTCPSTSRRLKNGDLVMLELGGCADGYWFDITRTLVVGGRPSQALEKMATAIRDATDAAFSTFVAGKGTAAELTEAVFEVLERHGFRGGIRHGFGHGVGFSHHEDRPWIGPGSKDTVEPGMVTSAEPGLYIPKLGGIRIEEKVLWEKDEVTVLSSFHNGLGEWSEEETR